MKGVFRPVVVAVVTVLLLSLVKLTDQNERKKRQILPDQPRIITQDGHLIFQSGINHNITFRSGSGGGVFLDNIDLKNAIAQATSNKESIDSLRQLMDSNPTNVTNRLDSLQNQVTSFSSVSRRISLFIPRITRFQFQAQRQLRTLDTRLTTVESQTSSTSGGESLQTQVTNLRNRVQSLETAVSRVTDNFRDDSEDMNQRISTLETTVRNLQTLLTTNECLSNPCLNGGTCVDMYNGYFCRCPANWQGPRCTEDVNECVVYTGTDMGCQNGATCVNTPGSFRCQCATNWHGIHCNERHDDCTGASHAELCGHGTCVNEDRVQPGQPKYRCVCEEGWTKDSSGPACNVDVNECATGTRCSVDPLVQCINIPGSFVCGSCPAGYTGNGYYCADVNECAINNGGCSTNPRVDCINNRGSRTCGPCPAGYQGDGISCTYVGQCTVNNGGCHPLATCVDDTGGFGRSCHCPAGYIGSGFGPNGCVQQSQAGGCSSNPCQNGAACSPVGSSGFVCSCRPGYSGTTCNITVNACASNPCQNGGTCTAQGTRYSCQCTEDFTGTNCEQAQQSCGGYLRGETGSFRYPRTTGVTYPHRVSCAWVITTTNDKIIRVTFPTFSLESHPECNFDFLQIHDGPTASSHMIGKYCGNNPPNGGSLNSTHNQLYFWFKSDASVASDGFEVNWTSHPPVCGGNLAGSDHGEISSPGYPGNYPHNRDCVWVVTVSPESNILFTFAHLALESHQNCSFDYLQIRDGETEDAPVLETFCNSITPAPIQTTGPYAFLRFHSDASFSDRGFHITYAALTDGRQGCGGALNGDEGELTSPGYPTAYRHNSQCVWIITGSEGSNIRLSFSAFDLETSSSCSFDSVTIRDGNDQTAPLLGRFCGNDLPAETISTGNVMFVELRTDESISGSGFQARWTTACGGTFGGPEGQIQSPNWPNAYSHNLNCQYLIQLPDTARVLLTFTGFGLEADDDCGFDFIEIYDGANTDAPLIGSRLCGTNTPTEIRSTGNMMLVRFQTDGSVANQGFQATYSSVEGGSPGCGGVLNANTGVISSPGHPNEYPHGINCTWYITVDPGLAVRLTFNMFSFEIRRRTDCPYDYVEVYDNSTMVPESKMGRYCGSVIPPVLTSTDNVMVVYMQTDASVAREGFSASFVALNVSSVCGSALTYPSGVITSPNYPNNYPHDRQCEWTITVADGNQISVNITDLQMEAHPNCNYDFLEIRNGGYLSSPLIWKYCGNQENVAPILSHSNRLYIRFKTDHSSSARGFRLEYDSAASGCGGDLTTPSGGIVSPNYPQPYSHNAECFWTISVSRGSTISIFFVDFDVEAASSCRYDYLEIRENGPAGRSLGKLCGTTNPAPITSSSNRLWLRYRTDASISGRGFRLQYHSDCNTVLTGMHGVIESPNFPNAYDHQSNCTWIIDAPLGNKINVSFAAFRIESHRSCRYDQLQIRDGRDATDPILQTLCGENIPDPFQSSGDHLWINFVSDRSVAHEGFRLEWIVDGCGGNLYGSSGTFTSLNYPDPYPHRRECQWVITVPTGKAIQLNITDFDVEAFPNCRYDVLEIYSGSDMLGPRIAQLCHRLPPNQPQVLHTTGNTAFVRFASDVSVSGRGFRITYTAMDGGCGGNFTAKSATIMSKNYPSNYEDNTECEWLITVAEGHSVVLTFTDFEVEGSSCNYDYVNLYDGPNANASLIVSLCGATLPNPPTYRSNGNQMFVRMRTDASVTKKGFSATYETGCGGTLDASVAGEIFSPNYPAQYPHNTQCIWIIRMPQANIPAALINANAQRVFLTFTHMDMTSECENEYVAVIDGIEPPVNQSIDTQNKYCGNSVPATITSYGSALTVVFQSANYTQGTGFRAVYSSALSTCGGEFSAESGRFTSPGYPNNYPMSVECVWQFIVAPGNNLVFNFPIFELDPYGGENSDYIEIRTPDVNGQLMGRWYGQDGPSNLTAMSGAWVKFRSDDSGSGNGFMAEWTGSYGGVLTGETGQIASPRYPSMYPANVDYRWRILAPQNKRVRITFNDFTLERRGSQECSFDSVEIFDGTPETGTSLGRFCGNEMPDPLYSTTNDVTVRFITDNSVQFTGFKLTWDAVLPEDVITPAPSVEPTTPIPGCGGDLTATDEAQVLTTPGYPTYQNNLECVWTITAPMGSSVEANITDINLESHGSCNFDSITFYDGEVSSRSMGSYCGQTGNTGPIKTNSNIMSIRFKTDFSVTRTGVNLTYQIGCGATIRNSVGVIRSPGHPNNYPDNQNCTWKVFGQPGKTIELQFNNQFNIADSGDCNNDYLLLLNGYTEQSPPLILNGSTRTSGRYCGTSAPMGLVTTDNHLFVNFISDGSQSGAGFSFTFQEKTVACGGRLRLTHSVTSGYITSPNYPEDYPHNADCVWVITAPASERVRVDFEDTFYIERHSRCDYDYVEFRDGGTSYSPRLGEPVCGNTLPGTTVSTGNLMYIRFRTDSSVPHAGFKAKYSIATCGGRISAVSGEITSPNYPANYDNNADCEWIISGPVGHYLVLNITNFNLQNSVNCSADFLEIRDGNATGQSLSFICGFRNFLKVETSDSFAYVRFKSDGSIVQTGFRIVFQASVEACGGQLTTPSGVITSPNYPGQYAHSRVCVWEIMVPQGRRVTLTFQVFRLETDNSQRCRWDFVDMINGILPDSPYLGRFCGETIPDPVESSGNTMRVRFRTDGSISNGGFYAVYTSDNEAECGGYITDSPGNITSPGFYGGNYSHNIECIWQFHNRRMSNSSIKLWFTTMQLEYHTGCRYDFVEVREGTDVSGQLVDQFCGNRTNPLPIVIPASDAWIRFKSDMSIAHVGFQLMYDFTNCGGVLTSPQGVITSPNYPSDYDHNDACAWRIIAPEGSRIRLRFTDFNFENHTACQYDYLQIQNGGLPDSPEIGKFCGSTLPPEFLSQSNELRITMRTDVSLSARGFRLVYNFDSGACGGLYHSNQGNLSTPNYPSSYPHNVECRWDINVDLGYIVKLSFLPPFDLEAANCVYDYVEVFDVTYNGTEVSLGRWCQNINPPDLRSTTNRMVVVFRSDFSTNGNGFTASWDVECSGVYTADFGIISSPAYPDRYPNNIKCNYTISPGEGKRIAIDFLDFELEGSTTCGYDFIEIWSGNGSTSWPNRRLGRFCGTTKPDTIVSTDQMYLKFWTDGSIVFKGFQARYYAEVCGGNDTRPTGSIFTPVHPNNYHHNANCSWLVTVQADRIIKFKFISFDLEAHSSCRFDYVTFYDGPDSSSDMIGRYCGDMSNVPEFIFTTGNQMYVNFITDSSVSKAGFYGNYWTTYGPAQGCGGTLRQSSGHITSVDADGDGYYEHDLDCMWLIYVSPNMVATFTISGIDIERHDNCVWDYVKIYDGETKDEAVLGTYCGQTVPSAPLVASSNVILVVFHTDFSSSGRGFNATFGETAAVCGGAYNATTDPQTLSSPSYPNPSSTPVRCSWVIDSGSSDAQVRLILTDLQLQSTVNCNGEFLSFRDNPLGDNGQEFHYCGSTLPAPFDSRGQQAKIIYNIPQGSSSRGFQLTYQIADCNKNYSSSSGRITSPGFPGVYPRNVECNLRVTSPAGTFLSLYFKQFHIEPHQSCRYDYLQVMNSTSDTVAQLCGATVPSPIFLPDNTATLKFKTDFSVQHVGYDITFVSSTQSSGCGGNITGITAGSITSPNFPGNFSDAVTCSWVISPPARRSLHPRFTALSMPAEGGSCDSNYVAIYRGPSELTTLTGRFCNMPVYLPPFSAPILVQYVSSGVGSAPVFRLTFDSLDSNEIYNG